MRFQTFIIKVKRESVNLPILGAAEMKNIIEKYEKAGEIENAETARSLKMHLTVWPSMKIKKQWKKLLNT